jgi:hypothetical protein
MMDFAESSKMSWSPVDPITDAQISTGCLQRIAAAVESLNRNWCNVIRENVSYRESNAALRAKSDIQERKIRRMSAQLKKAGVK